MVVLMVAVTILAVLTAAALPMWSHAMKREKEEELISRGWQYAEAIRIFQQRHGRLPTRLQELLEVKPRSIRRLWKDPMTESGEWGLVFQGVGAIPGQEGQAGRELSGSGGLDDGRGGRTAGPRAPRPGEQRTVGPITGVRSLSTEESTKILFDEESYDKWLFTVEKLSSQGISGIAPEGVQHRPVGPTTPVMVGGRPTLPRTVWIGRPFPPGIAPMQGQGPGGLPGGLQQGGLPGQSSGPDGRPAGRRPPSGSSDDR
jgi:type II secretory pathway pseudopilin PulG